jgi:predicted acylesterase/phospholipase RssA
MPFERQPSNSDSGKTESPPHSTILSEFGSGLTYKLAAPFKGAIQIATNETDTQEQKAAAAQASQSKAHLAGEVVGSATVFIAATALLRRVPLAGSIAPIAAGGVIGAIEPLKQGESNQDRLTHGLNGAAAIAIIEHLPKALSKTGLIATEKSLSGALISGMTVGAATEQATSFIQTGKAADLDRTAIAAAGFGLMNTAFHGAGLAINKGVSNFGERSKFADNATLTAISKDRQNIAEESGKRGWHLVCGSGGSKAGLTSTGVILACRAAELKLDTIGGVSGGAIPAVMAAAELPSHRLIELAKTTDFSGLLDKKKLITPLIRERKPIDLLQDGMYGSSKLGALTDAHVKEWPTKFWTMAVGDHSEMMFTKNGVMEYTREGGRNLVSNKPAQLGDAVRATCAIPGVLESVTLVGRRLFDGALGKFGKCPTAMVTSHFGAPSENIIASLPVGAMSTINKSLYLFAKYLSGNLEKEHSGLAKTAGIVIRPEVNSFHSMKFLLNANQKDEAILAGYRAAIDQFAKAKLISGDKLKAASSAGESMTSLENFFKPEVVSPFIANPHLLRLTARPGLSKLNLALETK